jgi:hypothetical protein
VRKAPKSLALVIPRSQPLDITVGARPLESVSDYYAVSPPNAVGPPRPAAPPKPSA